MWRARMPTARRAGRTWSFRDGVRADMRRAMETRAVIEQAKGILVAQHHCTPEQAFELLTRLSQATHRKLRDCAADLVTSTAEDRAR